MSRTKVRAGISQEVADFVIGLIEEAQAKTPQGRRRPRKSFYEEDPIGDSIYTLLERMRHSLLLNIRNRGAFVTDRYLEYVEYLWRERHKHEITTLAELPKKAGC